jgi:dTDP-4-amino-4,6-dideoxygalactose transaminase
MTSEKYSIPFNKPAITGKELEFISAALNTNHISGDGSFTRKAGTWLEEYLGVKKALLTTSCTHALEMAAFLLDFQPGDEVILPAFTFVSTANAFVNRGARPVFVDIRPDTLNLDESLLPGLLTEKTRAIVPVHYAGVGCEMDSIMSLAAENALFVIEDNAQGLFGNYKNQALGTFGELATLSFHETKNITCGEGGALLINDPDFTERAEIIREKGTNRSRFFRGQVDKYTWVDIGSSYLPSEILAAYLYAQMQSSERIQTRRKQIWEYYQENLFDWSAENQVRLPVVPGHCQQPYHIFYLLLPSLDARQALIEHLQKHRILSVFHYLPLNTSEMGRKLGGKPGQCPVTEDISDRLLRLPLFFNMTQDEQTKVVDLIVQFTV